jgi:chromosome segregation ATPase
MLKGEPRMKTLKLFSILCLFLSMALQSCVGKTDQASTSGTDKTSRTPASLESELKLTEARLSSLESENKELTASNEMLLEKLKELQEAAQRETAGDTSDRTPDNEIGGLSNQKRIALIGAKAIAEFKAEQAVRRLESLTSDLSKRDDDLKKALVDLEIVSQEREGLKKEFESLKVDSRNTHSQMNDTLSKLEARLAEKSDLVSKLEAELNDKEELLNTFKKAWSDATQLKSNAEERLSQINNNFKECQNQVAQMKGLLDQSRTESTRVTAEFEGVKKELASSNLQNRQLQSDGELYLKQIRELKETLAASVDKKQLELPASGGVDKSHSIIDRLLESAGSGKP